MTPAPSRNSKVRKEDPFLMRFWAIFMRYRGMVSWLGGGAAGSFITTLVLRFFLVAQLKAQVVATDRRFAGQDARLDVYKAQQDTNTNHIRHIEQAVINISNDICAHWSKAEQTTRQLVCDPTIYRGAP